MKRLKRLISADLYRTLVICGVYMRNTLIKNCIILLSIIFIFAFGACKVKSSASGVIKVGVFEPLSGANAAGGALEVEGIRLAYELNPTVVAGGKTYRVELVFADNKSERADAVNAMQRLVDRDKVNVVLGSWSSTLSMSGGEAARGKVPCIGLSCTNPLVTLGNDWYFRVCFIDPFQGTVMANYAFNELKAKTAVIVQEISNDYSVDLAKFFTDNFLKLTGKPNAILAVVNYITGEQDFRTRLSAVRSLGPDVIFAPGNYTESALVIKQARELGITIPIIGGDTWETPEFIDVGGDSVEGAVFSTFFAAEFAGTPQAKTFLDEYARRYSKEPAAFTAFAYDGYLVAMDAIKRAGSIEPAKIRDAVARTSGFTGATGITTLDVNGDATKSAYIKTVQNGKFVFKTIVNP